MEGAEAAHTILCDDIIELVAQTCEVAPFGKAVVVDEVSELMFSLPFVHQFRDEINAWFNRENKAWFQSLVPKDVLIAMT